MRAPKQLRQRARMFRNAYLAAVVAGTVVNALDGRDVRDVDFTPTSGFASTELASGRWMPHDHRPIVGFTPNGEHA